MSKVRDLPEAQKKAIYAATVSYRSYRLRGGATANASHDVQSKILSGEPLNAAEIQALETIIEVAYHRTTDINKGALLLNLTKMKFTE